MVSKFGVSKSTTVFKIALVKLINNYPKIKNSSLFLHYFKKIFENDYRNLQKKALLNLNK